MPSNLVSLEETGIAPYQNLAGHGKRDPDGVNQIVSKELVDAGIFPVQLNERYGEPQTYVEGRLFGWTFKRCWYYWSASTNACGITLEVAQALHREHGKYVRVYGHCGCPAPGEFGKLPVTIYHVDNPVGLRALAAAIETVVVGPLIQEATRQLAGITAPEIQAEIINKTLRASFQLAYNLK